MQFHDRKAIYLQIADIFFDQILRDKIKPKEKIPSVRELAQQLEVTPNTVQRSYLYLQDKGIIYNKRGIGYFVAQDAKQRAREIKLQEFVDQELPLFFSQMEALGLSFDELKLYYQNFKNKTNETQNTN
jgi:DNA-binding transcriptional regulator YhcF (GntR family)